MNTFATTMKPQVHSQADDISPTPTALIAVDYIDPPRSLAYNLRELSA